jgi:hypothetical protein
MAARKLLKSEWKGFLDAISKQLVGKQAEIEVASLALGDQLEAEWLPLQGLSYDPRSDLLDVALEGVGHQISRPREIYVDSDVGGLTSIEIVDGDNVRQIVTFRDPLMLPAPHG